MKHKTIELIFKSSITALFGFLIALFIMNWLVRCGEVIYYADGTWETGSCILIPYETKRGTWQ